MTLDSLKQLRPILQPPANPIDVDMATVEHNSKTLNVLFPADFIKYSMLYGSGTVRVGPYSWEIWSAARHAYPTIVATFSQIMGDLREALETADVSLGIFPEPGGLLPFGMLNDAWFSWKTVGASDDWKIVVIWSYEHDSYQTFDMGFMDFVFKLASQEIAISGCDTKWNLSDMLFTQDVYQT